MAADISADTGPEPRVGAGQPTCRGTAPAFEPKPMTTSTKAVLRTHGLGARSGVR